MTKFDKELKELSKHVNIPASYDRKVQETLEIVEKESEIPQKEDISQRKGRRTGVLQVVICVLCIVVLISLSIHNVRANILDFFRHTLMDFLQGDLEENAEDYGVESRDIYVESKPDLMMELQEAVIDSHNIYLLVKITAPTDIEFAENITFDYYCFCEGQNYNNSQLLSGANSCELLEVSQERPNVATYIVNMVLEKDIEEGTEVTACFKDLTRDPYSDSPELLVEGMWSITFAFEPTVTENIAIDGNSDMTFPYVNTTAALERIELTPLGLVVISDISNFPSDEWGISDTSLSVRLKMIDGSEEVVLSHNLEDDTFVQCSSREISEENGRTFQRDTVEFPNVINMNMVIGIYIEDLYIPLRENKTTESN